MCLSNAGHAEVFKCANNAGKVEYRDRPCPSGVVSMKVPVAPAPTLIETLNAKQLANQRAAELKSLNAAPPNAPVLRAMDKIIGGMKMNDIQQQDKLRQGDKRK